MNKSKKMIAMLVAAVMVLGTSVTALAGLSVSTRGYTPSGFSSTSAEIPYVNGFGALNSAIDSFIGAFESANHGSFVELAFIPNLVVSYSVSDQDYNFSTLTVTVSMSGSSGGSETKTFYVCTAPQTYYADKAAYDKAFADAKAAAEAAAAAEEEEEEEEEEAEEEPEDVEYSLSEEDLDTLVPLRAILESIDEGFTLVWDGATQTIEVYFYDEFVVLLIIDSDTYIGWDDEVYELGVAPTLIDDSTHVPVSFFAILLGLEPVFDEDGVCIGFTFPDFVTAELEEVE